jgi:hypothetical protein
VIASKQVWQARPGLAAPVDGLESTGKRGGSQLGPKPYLSSKVWQRSGEVWQPPETAEQKSPAGGSRARAKGRYVGK